MPTKQQTLVNAARCYAERIPRGDQLPALIYLANEILNSPAPTDVTIRITEAGETRMSHGANTRIIE